MTDWKPTRRDLMFGAGGIALGGTITAAGGLAYREHRRRAQAEMMRMFQAASDSDDGWIITPEERADLGQG